MMARLLLLVLGAVLLAPAPAQAGPRSGLEAAEIAAIPTGCWQTHTDLYGTYAIAFCLGETGGGAYRVHSETYECTGQASWVVSFDYDTVVYRMRRGNCGPTAAWTADRVECRLGRDRHGNIGCTYFPNAGGYAPTRFIAYPHPRESPYGG